MARLLQNATMGQSNMTRVNKILEKLQKETSDNTMLAVFEFQMLTAVQERQKALRPEDFKRAEREDHKKSV